MTSEYRNDYNAIREKHYYKTKPMRDYRLSRINKKKAVEEGKNTFLSGVSCNKCGERERYTSNNACKSCCLKQLVDPSMDQYRSKEQQQRWADNNKDRRKESYRKYYSSDKGLAKAAEKAARRRAWKKNNTPVLTSEEKLQIKHIYEECGRISKENWCPSPSRPYCPFE